jgi:thiol-disulfide isomerase/thioredoxin
VLANRQDAAQTAPSEAAEPASTDADALMLADYDATVYTELDEPVLLSAIADGKPLVMNFWATWCPYCVQEMPDFKDIYERFGDQVNFAFIDVTDGQRETRDKAAAWLADNGFDELPAYYDTDLAASTAFGAHSLPTTVVVSADGQILTVSPGVIDPELLSGALAGLV